MTVSFVAAPADFETGITGLTADEVLAIPSTQLTDDMVLVLASWKDFGITAQVSGYTEITEFADGSVATGNGQGSMKVGAWYKIATSDTEADPTLDFSTTTGLVGEGVVFVARKTLSNWITPTFVTAAWPSQSTGTVSASSTVDVPSGSLVLSLIGIRDDGTFANTTNRLNDSGSVITWTVNTTKAPTNDASTTTGNDMSCSNVYRTVTTGLAGATLTHTTTLGATETGAILWVVLADETPVARVPRFTSYPQILAH